MGVSRGEELSVQAGRFIRPPGAQLHGVINAESLVEVWRLLGACFAYPKPDGWRIQIHKHGTAVTLYSRSGVDWTSCFPEPANLLRRAMTFDCILDAELVGFDAQGDHIRPERLRRAMTYHWYILDALSIDNEDVTLLATRIRIPYICDRLASLSKMHGISLSEFTWISALDEWSSFYERCQARRREGYDGMIAKRLDAPYFHGALKLKPEDSVDAVVVGAYRDKSGEIGSLLLAVPSTSRKRLVPVAKVLKANTDWAAVWHACQGHLRTTPPEGLERPPEIPAVWLTPIVVVTVSVRGSMTSTAYASGLVLEAVRDCTLREDKGVDDATPLEDLATIAGLSVSTGQLTLL
jgi:DNA ligase 1